LRSRVWCSNRCINNSSEARAICKSIINLQREKQLMD
jgi:hypothetical protein